MGCGVGSVGVAIWDAGNGVSVRGPLFTREMAWGLPVASGRAHLARSLREPAVPERTTRTMRVAARAVKAGDQCAQERSGRASARTHSRSLRRNGVNKLKVLVSTRVVLACCASDAILPKEPCGPVKTLVDLEPDFPASPGGGESRRGSPLETRTRPAVLLATGIATGRPHHTVWPTLRRKATAQDTCTCDTFPERSGANAHHQ